MRSARTSIESVRRRELVEAAYLTFLDSGMKGMTMARIGERAGMSHGIVNYYFKSKDELLSAVMRKASFVIFEDMLRRLRAAGTPRSRVSAVVAANFHEQLYSREASRAWVSYYAMLGHYPEFERMQNALDRRILSNLVHALKQITDGETARRVAQSVALLIDGYWLRNAKSEELQSRDGVIAEIESIIDLQLKGLGLA